MKYAIRANMVQQAKGLTLINKEFDLYEFTSIGNYKARVSGEELFDTEIEALHYLISELESSVRSARRRLGEIEE